jgi:hypothetical protein
MVGGKDQEDMTDKLLGDISAWAMVICIICIIIGLVALLVGNEQGSTYSITWMIATVTGATAFITRYIRHSSFEKKKDK